MKKSGIVLMALALSLVAALAAGCSQANSSQSAGVSVTDMTGRAITLDAPAKRVVALAPADCEILYAIGAGETLVGRGEYCDYPAEVSDVPCVQSGAETNIEQIISLKPQVVLMSTMAQTEEQVASLEAAGIKVVVSNAQNIAGVYTAIEMIGKITGKDAEAASVIDNMKNTFAQISAKATGKGEKTVYFEVSPLEYGLWTAGSGTFMDELATMLGLTNSFADVQGWGAISQEQVIERDPDYIVTITMYFGEGPTPEEEIMGRAGWQDMKAIRNGAILNADSNEISRPGPRLADAIQTLYDFFYKDEEIHSAA
jgi:iron complex transport system substrate-binding protein